MMTVMNANFLSFLVPCLLLSACVHRAKTEPRESTPAVDSTIMVKSDTLSRTVPDSVLSLIYPQGSYPYSPEAMSAFMDSLRARLKAVGNPRLTDNIVSSGARANRVEFGLIMNTEEWRALFRRKVSDSPLIRFTGSDGTEPCTLVGIDDTLGVWIVPEHPAFPCLAEEATFIIYNDRDDEVETGLIYTLAYERDGRWYVLPINPNFNALGIGIRPQDSYTFTASLYPNIHPNRPGRYRFFKKVEIDGQEVTLMADFRLE